MTATGSQFEKHIVMQLALQKTCLDINCFRGIVEMTHVVEGEASSFE